MTEQQQRIAIAQACGWKWIQTNFEAESGLIGTDSPHSGNIPYQGTNYPSNRHLPTYGKAIPDYLNDLNAMHEAEKILTEVQFGDYYIEHLKMARGESQYTIDRSMVCATAAQRAEAFLKTIGKWEAQ